MILLKELKIVESKDALKNIPEGKILINTINAHSYNTARKDAMFAEALMNGDYLIPDGASVVKACRFLKAQSQPVERIAGWDLFEFEMNRINQRPGSTVMFLGSSESVLEKIRTKFSKQYPQLQICTYSPPYRHEFTDEDTKKMISAINTCNPDLLWIGLTAPKQEKWTYANWSKMNIHCHAGTIGAVFDFYAGTHKRAPRWWQINSLEWFYRLITEPRRMWRRYVFGNPHFLLNMLREKYF